MKHRWHVFVARRYVRKILDGYDSAAAKLTDMINRGQVTQEEAGITEEELRLALEHHFDYLRRRLHGP